MMKLAIWTYLTAVTISALAVAMIGWLFQFILLLFLGGKPMPGLTSLLTEHYWCALWVPLPLLFIAILLSRGNAATPSNAFLFAAVSTLAIVILFVGAAIALTLPFVPVTSPLR